jgi:atypical dual specificity phosphatase
MPSNLYFTWIEKPLLGALARPRNQEDLSWLRGEGIQLLLSLTEEPPPRNWINEAGLLSFHVPIVDMTAPTQEQLEVCVSSIARAHAGNMAVGVHCAAGLGRTGTVVAAWLTSRGVPPAEAIDRVRLLRPGSVETDEQVEAVMEYARQHRSGG